VIGFDTFGGFPPRRSPLDMYDHPDCDFTDQAAVRRYLDRRDIEIVAGTSPRPAAGWKGKTLQSNLYSPIIGREPRKADGPPQCCEHRRRP
jgi:hypothetical protein